MCICLIIIAGTLAKIDLHPLLSRIVCGSSLKSGAFPYRRGTRLPHPYLRNVARYHCFNCELDPYRFLMREEDPATILWLARARVRSHVSFARRASVPSNHRHPLPSPLSSLRCTAGISAIYRD